MVTYEQQSERLKVSYFSKEGDIEILNIDIPKGEQYVWRHCPAEDPEKSATHKSCLEKPVKKVRQRYLDKYRVFELLEKLPPEYKQKIYSIQSPKKWFLDIETESINGEFPDEVQALGRVLLITFCDTEGNVTILGIKQLSTHQIERITNKINEHMSKLKIEKLKRTYKVIYKYYETEPLMLKDFFASYATKMPCIFGWNVLKYDTRYLVNRAEKTGVNWLVCSPTGRSFTYFLKDKFAQQVKHRIMLPTHRPIHDYEQLYIKFDTSVKLKSSTALGVVATQVLGIPKVDYVGQLQELYDKDYERFVAYGSVDSILVYLIDEALHCFDNLLTLACEGKVPLHDAYFASGPVEHLYQEYFLAKKMVMVSEKVNEDDVDFKKKYKGAFVKEPETGIKDDVMIYDFESQFPNLMVLGNIGVDSLIGRTLDKGKTYIDNFGASHQIEPEKHIWLANGTVYTKEFDSSTRIIVNKLYKTRVDAKEAVDDIEEEIKILKQLIG